MTSGYRRARARPRPSFRTLPPDPAPRTAWQAERGQAAFPGSGFRQREVRLDVVAVAAAALLLDHVADLGRVRDSAECAALGDVHPA